MSLRRSISMIPLAVGAMVLAACGSGGGDGASGDADGTLSIAVSAPFSGPAAAAGAGHLCGVKSYFEGVNSDGGIGGHKFEVTGEDNKFDPGVSATIARKLANGDVLAVVVAGTTPHEASLPVLEARGIPVLATSDGAAFAPPSWEGDFSYNPVYSREAASAAEFISTDLGEKNASLAYVATATGQPFADSFPGAFEGNGGTVDVAEGVPATTTDFSPIAQKLKQANSPVVYAALLDTQLAGLQKAAAAIGFTPKWVTWPVGYGPSYLKLVGEVATGMYVSQWSHPETESGAAGVDRYNELVGKECPELLGDNGVKSGYALAATIAYGAQQLADDDKDVTREALIGAMSFDKQQMGITPDMSYTDADHAGVRSTSYWQVTSAKGDLKKISDFTELPAD